MARAIKSYDWEVDLVIPAPLSKQRHKERGYNQSAILAKPLAILLNKNYDSHILLRRKTQSLKLVYH
jgi:predicted amidophosphoribosyltransferase